MPTRFKQTCTLDKDAFDAAGKKLSDAIAAHYPDDTENLPDHRNPGENVAIVYGPGMEPSTPTPPRA